MKWWLDNRIRMIQHNLRDIDAQMDVDALIRELETFSCNVVMVGASGITTFFQGQLESDHPSPWLTGDKLGETIEKCHAHGIRVIARFDFSKTHESLLERHPEWYFRDGDGAEVRYNDTVQTCINGDYQQHQALRMIGEVLDRYEVDGIFFNMFGYQTRDYSGIYHGICQCESCKRRFKEETGLTLPKQEKEGDPVFERYKLFKQKTIAELLGRIRTLVDAKGRDVAVCTYTTDATDMVRSESNSAVDRKPPFWRYAASESCQTIRDGYPEQIACNCAINAVDIFYRFQGVSPYLTQMRLWQNMAAGSGLDFCIIGSFEGYPDRLGCEAAREVFRFHAQHEKRYGHLSSLTRVALLKPLATQSDTLAYRGAYRILKEAHVLFDLLPLDRLEREPERLDRYELVIAPDVMEVGPVAIKALERMNGRLVATGRFLRNLSDGAAMRARIFALTEEVAVPSVRSWYAKMQPKAVFTRFMDREWVFLDEPLVWLKGAPGTETWLPMITPAPYGPPERCFGHRLSEYAGAVLSAEGRRCLLAFAPERLYEQYGYEDHKELLMGVLRRFMPEQTVTLEGPACAEMFADALEDGSLLIQTVNQSGCQGITAYPPLPLQGLLARLPFTPSCVLELTPQGEFPLEGQCGAELRWDLPGMYRAFIVQR